MRHFRFARRTIVAGAVVLGVFGGLCGCDHPLVKVGAPVVGKSILRNGLSASATVGGVFPKLAAAQAPVSDAAGMTSAAPAALPASQSVPPLVPVAKAPSARPDIKVKGLYLTGWTVGGSQRLQHYIDLAKNTEINAYAIDIRDSDGYVGYESSIEAVRAVGGWKKKFKPEKVIPALHENGIYVIGRVVCFKDPVLSAKRPDLAILDPKGNPWKDPGGLTWLNPYKEDNWAYVVAIAKEGLQKGFDEIQFDYVRFANEGDKDSMCFGDTGGKSRAEIIRDFLAYARKEMPDAVLSADLFGIICESPEDTEGIGQYLELLGGDVDFISPMVYPSHYALGQVVNKIRYVKPDLEPYSVVYNTLLKAKTRIATVQDYKAVMRPYLQDFTATWLGKGNYRQYGKGQAREQIKAVYDAGYEQWIFWNARNRYSEDAFLPENPVPAATPAVASAAPAAPVEPEPVLEPVVP